MDKKSIIYAVEDDEGIQEVYQGALEDEFNLRVFSSATEFFDAFKRVRADLVLLDIMLPGLDGYTTLTKIREIDERVPVIIVSAKSDEISFVKGLNKGADDYVAKPFSVLELLARIKANLRRSNLNKRKVGDFFIDQNTYKIYCKNQELALTLKEYNLLKLLIENAGITVKREELFCEVWGEDFFGETRTLDMHVAFLREKIKAVSSKDYIVTVRGIGYRFEDL